MSTITKPVGGKIPNPNREEVRLVQKLLNKHRKPPLSLLDENGVDGLEVKGAIAEFQQRVVGMKNPDGRVDPGGKTLQALDSAIKETFGKNAPEAGIFSHPDADKVSLSYSIQGDGKEVPKLNAKAAGLLKSILASCGMTGAKLTSTLRTYHDQARITITQTYKREPATVSKWYGAPVLEACKKYLNDIEGFAKWWKEYDTKRGRVSSLHLSNLAMDVVPTGDRAKFAKKVKELAALKGTGVRRIIPKGVMNEPVDHVEFHFPVT